MLQQIKIIFLNILAILRKGLCCLRLRRHSTKIDRDQHTIDSVIVVRSTQPKERDWNSWDDKPQSVEEHIEAFRERIARPPTPKQDDPDFFSELAPVIQPQPKYYLPTQEKSNEELARKFTRLEATTDVPFAMNANLEDWTEDDADGGWEQLDADQAKQLIREKRREARKASRGMTDKNGHKPTYSFERVTQR